MKILILFHSIYGHIRALSEAIYRGANQVEGAEIRMKRVPEYLPQELLESLGAQDFSDVPLVELEDLEWADAIIVGAPTIYGQMSGEMKAFFDSASPLFNKNALVGKLGAAFTSASTQHGGMEAALLSAHTMFLHFGMITVGLPYTFEAQATVDAVNGGSPYGASTIAGSDNRRIPTEMEIQGAEFLGKHVAEIAKKLAD